MPEDLGSLLNRKGTTVQLATGESKPKPTGSCTTVEVDKLLIECSDLISPTFASWYAKRFYNLNRDIVLKLASQARVDGKDPAKLFSFLLKRTQKVL